MTPKTLPVHNLALLISKQFLYHNNFAYLLKCIKTCIFTTVLLNYNINMPLYHNSLFPKFLMFPLLLCCFCIVFLISCNEASRFTVDLIHRDSPLSPSYNPYATHFERRKSMFNHSFLRKSSLEIAYSPSKLMRSTTLSPGGYGSYLMKINIGTPPVEQIVLVDTTSDLTWIQCNSCSPCYSQNLALFDPKQSKSFETLSCLSKKCSSTNYATFCGEKNQCEYAYYYRNYLNSVGNLSMETFTFDSTSGGSTSFPKVVFGCGLHNARGIDGTGSGAIGLGDGAISLIKQLDNVTVGKFSYCLTSPEANASSKISFGTDAALAGPKVMSTPLVQKPPNNFYYVTLEGISVGTTRLEYKSHPMSTSFDKGNIAIDSSFSLTYLPLNLYNALESTLKSLIEATPVQDPNGFSNLCYQVSDGDGFVPPSITAHFTEADVVFPQETTFMEMADGLFCLTVMPSVGFGFLGNLHQINYLVGFDLVKGMVSFLPTDCSK